MVEKQSPLFSKAEEMASKQRDIGVAEFFARNKHLLGFDNPRKALLTTIKEAVDNSIDACEDADILPEITVEITEMGPERYRVVIEDNGPGIVKEQIPKIFAKLLYGSKFHSRKQQRGQQGIGISASVMYAQLTTGRPTKIISKTQDGQAHYFEIQIDTAKNEPKILKDEIKTWGSEHGTRVELDLEGSYQKGNQSVDEYLKETAVVNPHVTIFYSNPKDIEPYIFTRVTDKLPVKAQEIKPHPYGVQVGVLMSMLQETKCSNLGQFLQEEFSRVSASVAKEISANARLNPKDKPQKMSREHAEAIIRGIKATKIIAPPTDCLSPISSELLEKGVKKEINAEFYTAVSRPAQVINGNPFQVEVALAYGGAQPHDKQANIMRFANRVPLLYQQGGCGITKAITSISWKPYGLQQPGSSIPIGPISIAIHLASVWVPFTSESKEAIAHYDELIKEMKLALQEAGRQLGKYVAKKQRTKLEMKKRGYIQKYIPKLSEATALILDLKDEDKAIMETQLEKLLEDTRGAIDTMEFDPSKNVDFDEEWANIGKETKQKKDDEDKQ